MTAARACMDPLTPALRRAYRASGLTLGQIAVRAGVSENTVWNIMAGRNVRTYSLFAVCRVLSVSTLPVPSSASCEIAR
jgi:transcriptional regulator with XRE-family HTH domain